MELGKRYKISYEDGTSLVFRFLGGSPAMVEIDNERKSLDEVGAKPYDSIDEVSTE